MAGLSQSMNEALKGFMSETKRAIPLLSKLEIMSDRAPSHHRGEDAAVQTMCSNLAQMKTCLQQFVALNMKQASADTAERCSEALNTLDRHRANGCAGEGALPKCVAECFVVYVENEHRGICHLLDIDALPSVPALFGAKPTLLAHVPAHGEMFGYLLDGAYLFRAIRLGHMNAKRQYMAQLIDVGCVIEIDADQMGAHFAVSAAAQAIPGYARKCQIFTMPDNLSIFDLLHKRVAYRTLSADARIRHIAVIGSVYETHGTVDVEFASMFCVEPSALPSAGDCNGSGATSDCMASTEDERRTSGGCNFNPFVDLDEKEFAMAMEATAQNPFLFGDDGSDESTDESDAESDDDTDSSQITVVEIERLKQPDPVDPVDPIHPIHPIDPIALNKPVDTTTFSKKGRLCQSLCGIAGGTIERGADTTDGTKARPLTAAPIDENPLNTPKHGRSAGDLTIVNSMDMDGESGVLDQGDEIDATPFQPDAVHAKPSAYVIPAPSKVVRSPKTGDRLSVSVSAIQDACNFYAWSVEGDSSNDYQTFLGQLNAIEHKPTLVPYDATKPDELPKVFDYVFVQFDGSIYRAQIIGKFDTYLHWVDFFDHGECGKARVQDMFVYDAKWNAYPPFASHFCINGIKKFWRCHFGGKYFDDLQAMLRVAHLDVTVVDVRTNKRNQQTFVVDVLDENQMNVAHTMVRLNLALLDSRC